MRFWPFYTACLPLQGLILALATLGTLTSLSSSVFAQATILRESGQLDSSDDRIESDNSLFDQYDFIGQVGQEITITLESTEFDTYLILLDADGNLLVQNDDADTTTTNARLNFVLPKNGQYTVVANVYDSSGRGSYLLTVTDNSTEPGQTTAQSPEQPVIETTSGMSCDTAFDQLKSDLIGDRQLSVPYQIEREIEREIEGDPPEDRPMTYSLAMEGPGTGAILSSPQLLLDLSQSFISNCDSAASVSFGRYRTGEGHIIGVVDGQVVHFECAEDIGLEPGARTPQPPMPWGYYYCSL